MEQQLCFPFDPKETVGDSSCTRKGTDGAGSGRKEFPLLSLSDQEHTQPQDRSSAVPGKRGHPRASPAQGRAGFPAALRRSPLPFRFGCARPARPGPRPRSPRCARSARPGGRTSPGAPAAAAGGRPRAGHGAAAAPGAWRAESGAGKRSTPARPGPAPGSVTRVTAQRQPRPPERSAEPGQAPCPPSSSAPAELLRGSAPPPHRAGSSARSSPYIQSEEVTIF